MSDCVTCLTTPLCPVCSDGEECILTTQTCDTCPRTYCSRVASSNTSSNSQRNGAIAGGVIGGVVVVMLVALYFVYRYYYKPRKYHKERDEEFKLSTNLERAAAGSDLARDQRRLSQLTLSTMALSVFTKLSNIIPIAYIPGVTVKYNNYSKPASIYSDIDNASIHGSRTTTLIKAKPKLVQFDANEDEDSAKTLVSIVNLGGVKQVRIAGGKKYQPTLQQDAIIEEEEEDGSVFDLNIQLEERANPFENIEGLSDDDELPSFARNR